jgi:glycosyltransferase involved in cell wall biosynthesis
MAKIILDADLMRHPHSGLYHYCLNIGNRITHLLESQQAAHRLFYYAPRQECSRFQHPEYAIAEKPKWHRFWKPFLWDCALWHAPFQSGRIFPPEGFKGKILLTIHDLNCLHEGKPEKEIRKSIGHTQKLIDRSDALVCISAFCKQDVLMHCKTGNKPIHVIHNGTHAVGEPALSALSYLPHRPFYFGMGYVNRKKNYHVLVPLLEHTDRELIIAGRLDEPDYVAEIQALANRLGVSDRLRLTGPVSESEKAWYLRHCEAFLHPSLAEGFGAPVVEAMQFGKPLFLSNRTSLPEIAAGVGFFFTDFHPDKMRQVLQEGMLSFNANGMAEAIRRKSREYDWAQKAKDYLAVYESML